MKSPKITKGIVAGLFSLVIVGSSSTLPAFAVDKAVKAIPKRFLCSERIEIASDPNYQEMLCKTVGLLEGTFLDVDTPDSNKALNKCEKKVGECLPEIAREFGREELGRICARKYRTNTKKIQCSLKKKEISTCVRDYRSEIAELNQTNDCASLLHDYYSDTTLGHENEHQKKKSSAPPSCQRIVRVCPTVAKLLGFNDKE